MAAHRHPCVGDLTYGADPTLAKRLGLTRQWLHAVRLGFEHPGHGGWVGVQQRLPRRPGRPRWNGCARRARDRRPHVTGGGPGRAGRCHAVRRAVFVGEQGIPEDVEMDALRRRARSTCWPPRPTAPRLGTVRFLHGAAARRKYGAKGVDDDRTAVLGRLAVLKAARGTGLGADLVRAASRTEARALGLTGVYLEAQSHTAGLLRTARLRGVRPGVRRGQRHPAPCHAPRPVTLPRRT